MEKYVIDLVDLCNKALNDLIDTEIMDDSRQQLYGRGASATGSEDPFPDVQLLRAGVSVDTSPSMGDQSATTAQIENLICHVYFRDRSPEYWRNRGID